MKLVISQKFQTKIPILSAATIVIFMTVLTIATLFHQRDIIIQERSSNALSLARTLSVAVVDAIIRENNSLDQTEHALDDYMANFMANDSRVRYVILFDENSDLLTLSGGTNALLHTPVINLHIEKSETMIYEHEDFGWVLEVVYPLSTYGKKWGTMRLAIEADSIRKALLDSIIIMFCLSALITIVMIVLIRYLIGEVLGSLSELVRAMDSMTLEKTLNLPDKQNEIGVIHQHFNSMQHRLIKSQKELLNANQQLLQAERLASIGRLVAGIAHEINNPINGMRNCIYAVKTKVGNNENVLEYMTLMDEGLEHIASVIRKLLNFGRRQSISSIPVQINEQIENVLGLISYSLDSNETTIDVDLAKDLPSINADPQLIQEIFMNLILNAVDAVGKGGFIRVSTTVGSDDEVIAKVHDRGVGISTHDIKKIFDPFFTTKEEEQGTGLGLSICLGIVQSFGGTIDVESDPGVQTTFTLTFPTMAIQ